MHRQHTALLPDAASALQLGGHVPQHLVQRRLAGAVRAEAVFVVAEQRRAAAVGRDENDLRGRSHRGGEIEQRLRAEDGSDRVGV